MVPIILSRFSARLQLPTTVFAYVATWSWSRVNLYCTDVNLLGVQVWFIGLIALKSSSPNILVRLLCIFVLLCLILHSTYFDCNVHFLLTYVSRSFKATTLNRGAFKRSVEAV